MSNFTLTAFMCKINAIKYLYKNQLVKYSPTTVNQFILLTNQLKCQNHDTH